MKRLGLRVKIYWPEVLDDEDIVHLGTVDVTRKEDYYKPDHKIFIQAFNTFISRMLWIGGSSSELVAQGYGGITKVNFSKYLDGELWTFEFVEPTAVFDDDTYDMSDVNEYLNKYIFAEKIFLIPQPWRDSIIKPTIRAEAIHADIAETVIIPKIEGQLEDRPTIDTSFAENIVSSVGKPVVDGLEYILKVFSDIIYSITKSLLIVAIAIGIIAAIYFYYQKQGA